MTPAAKNELFGEDESLVEIFVDLSDPDNPQLRADRPVRITQATEDLRFKLGHSYPANKTSSMTDYSVTTQKSADAHHIAGMRDDAWGTNNVQDRFTGWAQSDAAQTVIERDDSGATWIIEALAELGDDDEQMERAKDGLLREVGGDETYELESLITIRVKLPDDDEYRYPGEIPVLNEVMVEQKSERLESMSVEGAGGEGAGYVTNEQDRVTGGSAGLFGMYGKKQREHFPDLSVDGSDAWRSRPISHETAAAIADANNLFEEFYRGLGQSRRLYVLPYLSGPPSALSPADFDWFVDTVYTRLRDADQDDLEDVIVDLYQRVEEAGEREEISFGIDSDEAFGSVRFATALVVSGNPNRLLFDTIDAPRYRPREVEQAHRHILNERPFGEFGLFSSTLRRAQSPLLSRDARLHGELLFGSYFVRTTEPTRSSREASETPKAGDIDDSRARRMRQFLTGETIVPETLLEEYVHQLVQSQRSEFDGEGNGVPVFDILAQYAQFRALSDAGVLESTPTATIANVQPITHDTEYESRDERLQEFLNSHEVLQKESRQAVFLLGGLVGRITTLQRRNDVSSTLVRRYPIDYLTTQSIKEVTNEVLQMNNTYIESEDELGSQYNARYVNRLPNLMLQSDPSTWKFTQNELQWLYALGIAYGISDTDENITEDSTEE
ncbi:TM1802 family CRISPR-associated protein [Halapricum desulfuricans]|nr:TM1802 family CRISPR-associated protein [Halapricum desulfuricans]